MRNKTSEKRETITNFTKITIPVTNKKEMLHKNREESRKEIYRITLPRAVLKNWFKKGMATIIFQENTATSKKQSISFH